MADVVNGQLNTDLHTHRDSNLGTPGGALGQDTNGPIMGVRSLFVFARRLGKAAVQE